MNEDIEGPPVRRADSAEDEQAQEGAYPTGLGFRGAGAVRVVGSEVLGDAKRAFKRRISGQIPNIVDFAGAC